MQFVQVRLVDPARRGLAVQSQCRCRSGSLPRGGTGCFNAHRAERKVRDTAATAGHQQIVDVA